MTARRCREALWTAGAAAAMAAFASAQDATPSVVPGVEESAAAVPGSAAETARRYAPVIWLAQEEPFYPMLPHPFAFDGIDNDRDGCFDLEDPDETTAFANHDVYTKTGQKQHADALRVLFGRLLDIRHCVEREMSPNPAERCAKLEEGLPGPTGSGCAARVALQDFRLCGRAFGSGEFRCGPEPVVIYTDAFPIQPSEAGAKDPGSGNGTAPGATPQFKGIQYWMYYPWDAEHIDDGEHISVFYDSAREQTEPANVKVVIGAGHLPNTANNLLYASVDEKRKTLGPRGLPRHLPFLVELGKHASAPDFNCNGQFDIGVDANEGPQGVWGSRDVVVLIDKKGINRFDPWMSVARDGAGFLVEKSFFAGDDARDRDRRMEWRKSCPEFTRGHTIFVSLENAKDAFAERRTAVTSHAYRLVSGTLLRELGERVADAGKLAGFLASEENRSALWGSEVSGAQARKIAECAGAPCTAEWGTPATARHIPEDKRGRRDVWMHGDYWSGASGRYENDFKRNLFKQFGLGASYLVEGGNAKLGAVARVAGGALGIVPESSLDLGVWFDTIHDPVLRSYGLRTSRPSDISLTYNAFRTSYRGAYVGGAWHARNYDVTQAIIVGERERTEAVVHTFRRNVSLFAGFAVGWAMGPARVTLRAGGHGSLIRGTVKDGTAHETARPAGLHVAVEFLYGFRNEAHPLTR